jgi:hypothetical protein
MKNLCDLGVQFFRHHTHNKETIEETKGEGKKE